MKFSSLVFLSLTGLAKAQNADSEVPLICQPLEGEKAQGMCVAWETADCVTPNAPPCSSFATNFFRATGEVLPQLVTPSPSGRPSHSPSDVPSLRPTTTPSSAPTMAPSDVPSLRPSTTPSSAPTMAPSDIPTAEPTTRPTPLLGEECVLDSDCGPAGVVCDSGFCVGPDCTIGGSRVCCANTDCPVNEVCEFVAGICIANGNPRFTLTWFGEDDLDLWVIAPNGFTIGWLFPFDESSGGLLDRDDVGGLVTANRVENIVFPIDGSAPTGTYSAYVRTWGTRNGVDSYTLSIYVGTQLIESLVGVAASTPNYSFPSVGETPFLTFEQPAEG